MARVVLYERGIRALTRQQGPVGRLIQKKANEIEAFARQNIEAKFESRTGDLAASLKQVPIDDPQGFRIAVGADAQHRGFPYARALELNQDPRSGGPLLAGNNQETPVANKAYMVPAVEAAGFRRRSA